MAGQRVYHGRKFDVWVETAATPAGEPLVREIVRHPGSVVILPWVDAEHICLVRNQRLSVGETLLELPAGTLEPGENPLAAAQRELAEETGFTARSWQRLHRFYPSPGITSEVMHLFVARDLEPGPSRLQADEDLTAFVVPWTQAIAWLKDGTIADAKTMLALLLWEFGLRGEDC